MRQYTWKEGEHFYLVQPTRVDSYQGVIIRGLNEYSIKYLKNNSWMRTVVCIWRPSRNTIVSYVSNNFITLNPKNLPKEIPSPDKENV